MEPRLSLKKRKQSKRTQVTVFSWVLIPVIMMILFSIYASEPAYAPETSDSLESQEVLEALEELELQLQQEAEAQAEAEAEAQAIEEAEAILRAERIELAVAEAIEASYYADVNQAKAAMTEGWTLIPNRVFPGDVFLVRHHDEGTVEWQGKSYELQLFGTGYYTYLPVSMSVQAGEYPIGDQLLTVEPKSFKTQYLEVSEQLNSIRQDTDQINADQKKIDEARSQSAPSFLFDSPFIQPLEGILTTPFGYTRYVNGKYASSHTAIDLAAPTGTPIHATNDGVVALADSFHLTGYTIYLDHGLGLFSQYAHLSELNVENGDKVKKGDVIGLVGSTGFSTGPHLHFTFWVHNVPVNPNLFFETTPFGWMITEP